MTNEPVQSCGAGAAGELSASDWDARYRDADTPWDMNQPSPPLSHFLRAGILPRGRRVLVPGCGAGHELSLLANAGYEVVGADIAPRAVALAQRAIAGLPNACVICADLLDPAADAGRPYDWVFEQTFFCALPPARRGEYAAAMARFVRPGGELWALSMRAQNPGGPPFDSTPEEYVALLSAAGFATLEVRPLDAESHPSRRGRETLVRLLRR